jgi:large subunit ribosomal protein L24
MAARIRKGDSVVVISGEDKGKTGTVTSIRDDGRVIVSGINMIKRHMRPNPQNQQGGIVVREAPIFASKVMLVDPQSGKPTRVRFKVDGNGNKVRIAAKSGAEIPAPPRREAV